MVTLRLILATLRTYALTSVRTWPMSIRCRNLNACVPQSPFRPIELCVRIFTKARNLLAYLR